MIGVQEAKKPFVSCLDEEEWADLKREAALQWHFRHHRCPECGCQGYHVPRCPESKGDDDN